MWRPAVVGFNVFKLVSFEILWPRGSKECVRNLRGVASSANRLERWSKGGKFLALICERSLTSIIDFIFAVSVYLRQPVTYFSPSKKRANRPAMIDCMSLFNISFTAREPTPCCTETKV